MGEHPVVTWYRATVAAAWGGGRARAAKRKGVAYTPVRGSAGLAREQEQARHAMARRLRSIDTIRGHRVAARHEQRAAEAKRWRDAPVTAERMFAANLQRLRAA